MYNLNKLVSLLEQITGKKVKLVESNEAIRNIASQSLNSLSESLELARQNVTTAIEKIKTLNLGDVSVTKLQGLSSILDSNITTVSEIITSVTGMQTTDDMLDDMSIEEADDSALEMSMDDAVDNTDQVKKVIDKGMNVKIIDNDNSY